MKNRELKAELLINHDYDFYRKNIFVSNLKVMSELMPLDKSQNDLLNNLQPYLFSDLNEEYSEIELKSLKQLYDARRQKVARLKKRVKRMIDRSEFVYFFTLTWRDEVLNNTSQKTRRTYVQRFLSSLDYIDYFANIDFGSETEREHYHAIVCLKSFNLPEWEYGWFYYEKVRVNGKSISRISNYVNKLTYHAYKDSTKNERCIAPKQTYYNYEFNGKTLIPIRGDLVF